MDTKTTPAGLTLDAESATEIALSLCGTGLDLQCLMDEATARLQACDVAAALERVELAWMLHRDPRLEPIAAGLREALGNPRRLVAHCLREAERALECGEVERARVALEQARELEPASPLVLNALGWFLTEQADLAGAQVAFLDVVRLCPGSPRAHANFAGICLRRGLQERAVHHLRRCLDLDPSFAPARAALEQLGEIVPRDVIRTEAVCLSRPEADGTEAVWTGFAFLPLARLI